VGYSLDGFSPEKSRLLFYQCHQWTEQGVSWLMSNSDTPLLQESFPDKKPEKKYHTQYVTCRRAINAKHPESVAKEVMVYYMATNMEPISEPQSEEVAAIAAIEAEESR
jgi:hypothetical protein